MLRNNLKYIVTFLLVSAVAYTASNNFPDLRIKPKSTASQPSGTEGQLYADATTNRLQYKDDSTWYNLIGPATTDTLTNKTLTGNTAANLISGSGTMTLNTSGTITVPNGTDTLVGKATTDVLTNKTITVAANSITSASTARAAQFGSGGALENSTVTTTELGYLSGVTSAVQTQINSLTALSGFGQSYQLSNISFSTAITTNTLVISLKQNDGTSDCSVGSPCTASFRNGTAATGGYSTVSFTAANTVTLAATDSIGALALSGQTVYVYLVSDTSSEICASMKLFDEGTLQSASALTGGADTTLTTLWCTSAHTSKPIRLIGKVTASWSNPNWGSITETASVPFKNPLLTKIATEAWTDSEGNCTTSVELHRVGNRLLVSGKSTVTGAFGGGTFDITVPTQYATTTAEQTGLIGTVTLYDATGGIYFGAGHFTSSTNIRLYAWSAGGSYLIYSNVTGSAPFVWANGDFIYFKMEWVVAAWDY